MTALLYLPDIGPSDVIGHHINSVNPVNQFCVKPKMIDNFNYCETRSQSITQIEMAVRQGNFVLLRLSSLIDSSTIEGNIRLSHWLLLLKRWVDHSGFVTHVVRDLKAKGKGTVIGRANIVRMW